MFDELAYLENRTYLLGVSSAMSAPASPERTRPKSEVLSRCTMKCSASFHRLRMSELIVAIVVCFPGGRNEKSSAWTSSALLGGGGIFLRP